MRSKFLFLFFIIFVIGCDEVSDTFFYLENKLDSEVEIKIYTGNVNESYILEPTLNKMICSSQRLGKNKYEEFEFILSCADSISVTDSNNVVSAKNFMVSSEWTYSVKPSYEAIFVLVIDESDF